LTENCAERRGRSGCLNLILAPSPKQQAGSEVNEVNRASVAHHLKCNGPGTQKGSDAHGSREGVKQTSSGDAECGDKSGKTSLSQAARDDVHHVRAGRQVQYQSRGSERQEMCEVRHGAAILPAACHYRDDPRKRIQIARVDYLTG
jgi:hypothetical protein